MWIFEDDKAVEVDVEFVRSSEVNTGSCRGHAQKSVRNKIVEVRKSIGNDFKLINLNWTLRYQNDKNIQISIFLTTYI